MTLTVSYVRMAVASLFEKGLLLGLYLATVMQSLRWLVMAEDKGRRIRKIMTLTTVLIFGSTVISFVGDMVMTFLALHLSDNHFNRSGIAVIFCVLGRGTIFLIVNAVMIYRCWIISFNKWYIICPPVALWFTCLINSILATYCYWHVIFSNALPTFCQRSTMSRIFFAGNVAISIYTTCVIVYQILVPTKYSKDKRRLYNICRILIESGMLHTVSSTIYLITVEEFANLSSSDITLIASTVAQSLTLPLVLYLPGIAFNLITIRIGQQQMSSIDSTIDSLKTNDAPKPPSYISPIVIHKEVHVEHMRTLDVDVETSNDES